MSAASDGDDERATAMRQYSASSASLTRGERQRRAHDAAIPAALPGSGMATYIMSSSSVALGRMARPTPPAERRDANSGPVAWFSIVVGSATSESARTLPTATPGGPAEISVMRVPEARPELTDERLQLRRASVPICGATSGADELRARLKLVLGVGEVEAPARSARRRSRPRPVHSSDDERDRWRRCARRAAAYARSLVLQAVPHAAHRLDVRAARSRACAAARRCARRPSGRSQNVR